MDDLIDIIGDIFGELYVWEKLNRFFRKKIPLRPLRWLIVSLIYLLILGVIIAIAACLFALFT